MSTVIVIDNYDSFIYNIVQIVSEFDVKTYVFRNDQVSIEKLKELKPDKIIISPGSGSPENKRDVGISIDVIKYFYDKISILGICLGHQVIGYFFGAKIRKARKIMHGKYSIVKHFSNSKLFKGIPEKFRVIRYHSLVIDNLPDNLKITSISLDDFEIMSIEHKIYPVFGIQFHPESVGTEYGKLILKNFIDLS